MGGGRNPNKCALGTVGNAVLFDSAAVGVLTRLDLFVSLQPQQNLIMGGGNKDWKQSRCNLRDE